jgi:hypothetical protein
MEKGGNETMDNVSLPAEPYELERKTRISSKMLNTASPFRCYFPLNSHPIPSHPQEGGRAKR